MSLKNSDGARNYFKYRAAKRLTGRLVTGTLLAADEPDLDAQLRKMDMELIRCKPVERNASLKNTILPPRIDRREIIKLFIMLGRLTRTGVPILNALQTVVASSADETPKGLLFQIARDVAEGTALSQAMRQYPRIFPMAVISIIAAREETGDMSQAFDDAAAYLKWVESLSRRIKRAMRYPLLLIVALLAVVTVMMAYVVPSVVGFISELDQELPFATTSLVAVSEYFQAYWWFIAVVVFVFVFLTLAGRRLSMDIRRVTDNFILRAPYFGSLIRSLNTIRFMQTFVVLYESGIPILQSFDQAIQGVSNSVMKNAFAEARQAVSTGTTVAEALAHTGLLENTTIEMLNVGEEAGRIEEIIHELLKFYNDDLNDRIEKSIAMIEPAITVVLGALMLWIIVGVFGPIYNSFERISL